MAKQCGAGAAPGGVASACEGGAPMREKMTACWLSAGVSSFVGGWLVRDAVDKYLYIDIADQHTDSTRFIADCEAALGKKVETLKSTEYASVGDVCRSFRFVASAYGAKCTEVLKRRVRKKWEWEHRDYALTYVWGFDCDEKDRAERLVDAMPDFEHRFPLIDNGLTKQDAHGICSRLGIHRPIMYDMGYSNNNCVGCVKGGMGYWNKIRRDFPEVFADRAAMEREIGHSILHTDAGPLYLDELDPSAGRMADEIMEDCGIFCTLALYERGCSNGK